MRLRQAQVAVRLSPAEHEAVLAAAGREGCSPASALRNAFLAANGLATTTEHAVQMSGGGYLVRPTGPLVEKCYPLAQWIRGEQRSRPVWRRRVIVVEDWAEVPPAGAGVNEVNGGRMSR